MILLYSATLFLGAGLLFLVEPLTGKVLLPVLGGAPAVWITTQLFFQLMLLGGYAYGHLVAKRLAFRHQAQMHLLLLLGALALLPIAVHPAGSDAVSHPVLWLLALLASTVGLPFALIAASGPLLQRWLGQSRHHAASDPYFLYAASNLGSVVGLLAYPLLLEPLFTLHTQALMWTWFYRVLIALLALCALAVRHRAGARPQPAITADSPQASARAQTAPATPSSSTPVTWARRARWVVLAAVPSSLMLGATSFVTRDLAPVPLLWVLPLAVYLLSLVVAFAPGVDPARWVSGTRRVLPAVVIALVYTMAIGSQRPLWLLLLLHVLTLAVAALMCHCALAADRPATNRLTEFYLWVAAGGALGGVANAILAPLLFVSLTEYPLAIVAACLLRPTGSGARPTVMEMLGAGPRVARLMDITLPAAFGLALAAVLRATASADTVTQRSIVIGFAAGMIVNFARRPTRFALAVGAIFVATSVATASSNRVLTRERTFFGVYQVARDGAYHELFDGTTLHGIQRFGSAGAPTPLSYYSPSGPVGQVFAALPDRRVAARTAVVGLGTGAMACYSHTGEHFTFYEIDPAVVRLASDPHLFTYLRDCAGRFRVVVGDARRALDHDARERFGIIALDAFSSDAIPVHLLTRRALALYLTHLDGGGLLLVHISNRYLDLRPELGGLARGAGLLCRFQHHRVSPAEARLRYDESTWVVMARRGADLGALAVDSRWVSCPGRASQAWSDDHSSLVGLLKWG